MEARAQAVAFIGISHKSSGKVTEHLVRKGFSREIAESAAAGLAADGYIDDLRIARALAQGHRGRKAEGKQALRQRLLQAGISRAALKEFEEEIPADEETIEELFDGKILPELRRQIDNGSFDADTWMNKTFRFLITRGYTSSLAMDTLRKRIHDVE